MIKGAPAWSVKPARLRVGDPLACFAWPGEECADLQGLHSCWESRLTDVSVSGKQAVADGLLEGPRRCPREEGLAGCEILLEGGS